jgi:hypothetical protein
MQDARCEMQDTGCRIQDADPVCGFFEGRCQVPGTRYRVPAIWYLAPGTRHRSRSDAEGRTLSTEDRARPRLGPRDSAMEEMGAREVRPSRILTEGREPKAGHRIRCPVPDTRYLVPYCPIALLPYCPIALMPDYLLNLNRAVIRMQDGTLPSPWPYPASCILHPASCILYLASCILHPTFTY